MEVPIKSPSYFAAFDHEVQRACKEEPTAQFRTQSEVQSPPYPSFAFIVIFAFSTFDTGHPALAF